MPSADQPSVALEAPANGCAFWRTSGGYIGQFDSFRVIACCAVVLQHSLLWTIARVGGRGSENPTEAEPPSASRYGGAAAAPAGGPGQTPMRTADAAAMAVTAPARGRASDVVRVCQHQGRPAPGTVVRTFSSAPLRLARATPALLSSAVTM